MREQSECLPSTISAQLNSENGDASRILASSGYGSGITAGSPRLLRGAGPRAVPFFPKVRAVLSTATPFGPRVFQSLRKTPPSSWGQVFEYSVSIARNLRKGG